MSHIWVRLWVRRVTYQRAVSRMGMGHGTHINVVCIEMWYVTHAKGVCHTNEWVTSQACHVSESVIRMYECGQRVTWLVHVCDKARMNELHECRMYESHVRMWRIACTNLIIESRIRITCTNHIYESHIQMTCTNHIYEPHIRNTYTNHTYEPHIRTTHTNYIHESNIRMWQITSTNHINESHKRITYTNHFTNQIHEYGDSHIRTTYTNHIHESNTRIWRLTCTNVTNYTFECDESHIRMCVPDVRITYTTANRRYLVVTGYSLLCVYISFWAYLHRKALYFRKRNLYFCNRAPLSESFAPHICAPVCRQGSFLRDSFHVVGLFPQNIVIFPENVGLFCGYIGFFCGVSKRFAPQLVFDSWLTRAVPTNAHAHTHSLSLSLSLSHSLSLYLSLFLSHLLAHTRTPSLSLSHSRSLSLSLSLAFFTNTPTNHTHTHNSLHSSRSVDSLFSSP